MIDEAPCGLAELGHIFDLGTKYSEAMGMRYTGEDHAEQAPIMGCYGIGLGRLMCSVMEVRHDRFGPIWPISIAPWQVHLNALKVNMEAVRDAAERLYTELARAGIEVLYDDRNERAGVQFADADLLGVPFRLVVSERNLSQGGVELVRRGDGRRHWGLG